MVVVVYGHDLLQPAKPAAHTGGENCECRLFHVNSPLLFGSNN